MPSPVRCATRRLPRLSPRGYGAGRTTVFRKLSERRHRFGDTPNTPRLGCSNAIPWAIYSASRITEALSINHQGQFPSSPSLQFVSKRIACTAMKTLRNGHESPLPGQLQSDFQGTAASFHNSLSNEVLLILPPWSPLYWSSRFYEASSTPSPFFPLCLRRCRRAAGPDAFTRTSACSALSASFCSSASSEERHSDC